MRASVVPRDMPPYGARPTCKMSYRRLATGGSGSREPASGTPSPAVSLFTLSIAAYQPSSPGKIFAYSTLTRGSAIISATVLRQVR